MKKYTSLMVLAILGATLPLSDHVFAQDSTLKDLQNAISKGDTDISMRYRYERVDQDNIDKPANASTLLTRLTYNSVDLNGFYGVFEVGNISAIGNENYNSTVNGNTAYPVVADPTLTEVNLAFVGYKTGGFDLSFGRQRVNHNDQRFVGGVAWRQNEQTYDAYRVQYADEGKLKFDYSYVYNVNRIFGPDSPNADLQGNIHLLNVNYNLDKTHKLTAYAYELDFDTALAISTRTLGASYDGNVGGIKLHAAYAVQSDTGNNPNNFSTQYVALELGTKVSAVNVGIGYESLGSDNGVGFTTPLATLHKFQGFADKFLNTPGVGVNDLYVKASGKIGKINLTTVYHQLDSDAGSIDYGNELNLIVTYPVADRVSLLLKYANYSADGFAVDTDKFWSMVNFKL